MQATSVKLEGTGEDRVLVITVPVRETFEPSSSGKTLIVSSVNVKTDVMLEGKQLTVGVNAYIKK